MSRYASQASASSAASVPSAQPFQGNDLFATEPASSVPAVSSATVVDSRESLFDKQRQLAQEKARQRMSNSLTVGGGADPLMPGGVSLGGPGISLSGPGFMANGSLLSGGNGALTSGLSGLSLTGGLGGSSTATAGAAGGRTSFASARGGVAATTPGAGLTSPSYASSVTASTSATTATAAATTATAAYNATPASTEASAIAEALKEREKQRTLDEGGAASGGGGGGVSPGNKQHYAPITPMMTAMPPAGAAATAAAHSSKAAVTGLAALDLTDIRRFLTSPVPKAAGVIYCRIERDKKGSESGGGGGGGLLSGLTGLAGAAFGSFPSYHLYLQTKETLQANETSNQLAAGHSSSASGGGAGGHGINSKNTALLLPKGVTSTADIFLLAGKKRSHNKTSNYLISLDKRDLNRDSDSFLGKLRSNYFGTEFTAYDDGQAPSDAVTSAAASAAQKRGSMTGAGAAKESYHPSKAGLALRQEIASIHYASNVLASRGPRKMKVVIPRPERGVVFQPESDDAEGALSAVLRSNPTSPSIFLLTNKQPKWNDSVGSYVLNFNGRVTMASVKNFQLAFAEGTSGSSSGGGAATEDEETVVLQFGRVDKDSFTMDLQWPLSPLQAFAITLSSFDYKLACE